MQNIPISDFFVPGKAFDGTLSLAQAAGFRIIERPGVWGSRATLLGKNA
jgi:hypothetical protein